MKELKLTLKVQNRDGILFNSPVKNITSYNDKGEFDVLPMHAQFISLIKDKIIVRLMDGQTREIELDSGIMHVNEDQVNVYLGVKQELLARKKA